jgi:tetratricopeptide (TPR) repeat protein
MPTNTTSKLVLKKAFKNKKILICDPYHLVNSFIKKTLNFYGADFPHIYTSETFEESLNLLESIEPDYIFSFHRDKENQTCDELYFKHLEMKTDRTKSFFFLLVREDNALYAASFKRSVNINGICFHPFTIARVEKSILSMLKKNQVDNKYLNCMNRGHTLLNSLFYEDAKKYFTIAIEFASFDPADAIYYQGICFEEMNKITEAVNCWQKALDYCLHHAKSLKKLFLYHHRNKDYQKAYHIQVSLIANHPLDPMLISHYILIAVRMKKYGEIYDLALHFQKLNYKIKETERSIAAGLIMSGRHFMANKEQELGKKILLKAAELAEGNIEMFQNISRGLLDGGFFVEAYELIGLKSEENPNNIDFKVLEVDLLFKANELPQTLQQGLKLIKEEVIDHSLYLNVILASIRIGRNKSAILELIDTACSMYPEHLESYIRIRDHYFGK